LNPEFGYGLAFLTGLFGALHCLGMCSGINVGFAVRFGRRPLYLLLYHGTRILVYSLFGVLGALLARVLVLSGIVGKGQGVLMMGTGVVIIGIGLILFRVPNPGKTACTRTEPTRPQEVGFQPRPKPWFPLLGGLLNGLAPCSLVFSVALQAAATTDPLRAGLLMLVFGLGTLPAMLGLSLLSAFIGERMRGLFARLAALTVFALGAWTFYQGWVFFDIMRGLGNW